MRTALTACVVVAAVACKAEPVDFSVDATAFAETHPDAVLRVELVESGTSVVRAELDLAVEVSKTFPGVILPVSEYGVAAYVDLNADGDCDPTSDLGWWFIYTPARKVNLDWVPETDKLRDNLRACVWFEGIDTAVDTGEDTDTL